MSSMILGPVGSPGDLPEPPVQKVKRPIREILKLSPDSDSASLRAEVIDFFILNFLIKNLEAPPGAPNVSEENLYKAIDRKVEELMDGEYKYARANAEKNLQSAIELSGLPVNSAKSNIYFVLLQNDLRRSMNTMVGDSRNEYRIPDSIESLEQLYEDMHESVSQELLRRDSILKMGFSKDPLGTYLDTAFDYAMRQVHGYDPEFDKVLIPFQR